MELVKCQICGALVPVMTDADHAPPRGTENLIYLCADCNTSPGQRVLRGFEFEAALADLMQSSGKYRDVSTQRPFQLGRAAAVRVDIFARGVDGIETIVIECKETPTIGNRRLRDAFLQLKTYGSLVGDARLILALPARLSLDQKAAASEAGVEVWDLDTIAVLFREQLDRITNPLLRATLLAAAALNGAQGETPEARLLRELRELGVGRANWSAYQKLVARIFERLFCPPLSAPYANLSDEADVNRRDIILPNYAESGFWLYVRERYAADFIVVDAKNYTEAIGKSEALQILNYLKKHGAGQLGIIVTRKGADASCMVTIRDHWAQQQKLLMVLSDEHIDRMLRAKEACGPPEDVIRQWIEEFRLSM